ncbi:MAG: hypothetical protein ABIB71_05460 [Candidatus Woesearchaeota archaeon]
MEKTTSEQKDKTAYQLKKLLGSSKKQDLGNVERWKQIPVEYIVTANTLGIELNDSALKRLNEAEDKEHAFESIYVTQYFSKEAKKLKKHDLAKKLEGMVEDESIATEDIALYAISAIKGELPKKKLLEKLAKAYSVNKSPKEKRFKRKATLEKKLNKINFVLVPVDKEGFCNIYMEYDIKSTGPFALKNTKVNIYSMRNIDDAAISKALEVAGKSIIAEAKKKKFFKTEGSGIQYLITILLGTPVCCVLSAFFGTIIGSVTGSEEGMAIGATAGALFGLATVAGAASIPAIHYCSRKPKERYGKALINSKVNAVNVIESKDLNNLWEAAFKNEKAEAFTEEILRRAIRCTLDGHTIIPCLTVSPKISEAYKEKEKASRESLNKKIEEDAKRRKEEEEKRREQQKLDTLIRIPMEDQDGDN